MIVYCRDCCRYWPVPRRPYYYPLTGSGATTKTRVRPSEAPTTRRLYEGSCVLLFSHTDTHTYIHKRTKVVVVSMMEEESVVVNNDCCCCCFGYFVCIKK
eukprot:scaffold1690_cov182-Amphora_coffeaeformis.AAC.74